MKKRVVKAQQTKKSGLPMKVQSALKDRAQLAAYLGMQFSGSRDLYSVFGYPTKLLFENYLAKYLRQNIAKRIVNAPASATWRNPPVLGFSTSLRDTSEAKSFLTSWESVVRKFKVWSIFERADRLAGLGNYSILLLGFNDTSQAKDFACPVSDAELLYIHTYSQPMVSIKELDMETSSARFGQPLIYQINMGDAFKGVATNSLTAFPTTNVDVHYSRVVHIAEDAMENPFIGTPRLQNVYNDLEDLAKVSGGTAETYWLAGNKGMQIDVDKEAELGEDDEAALEDEIEEYQHQLRRFIRTRGVTIKDLKSDVPNPKQTFDMIIALISGTTGIPQRILTGSELGQLASDQDRANWSDRIKERRVTFAEPCVLLPFKERLIGAGVLPKVDLSEVIYDWPPNFQLTPLEEAQSQAQKARAAINLAKMLSENPILTLGESRGVIGFPAEPPEPLPEPQKKPQPPTSSPGTQLEVPTE